MPQDLRLAIRLDADAKGFRGEMRLTAQALGRLTGNTARASVASRRLARTTGQVEAAARRSGSAIGTLHRRVLQYGSALLGLHTAATAARGLLRHADAFRSVSNAVRLATESAEAYARVQSELYAIAHRTRAPIAGVARLYQRLSLAASELGASERDLLAVTEGVGQSLAISGTSAAAAQGALIQLTQAFGGSVVRAEEFNSLMEGAPALLRVVARHMDGVGGSVSLLRQRVVEGEVSSREFFEALLAGLPELERGFARTSTLVSQAITQIDTALTRAVGEADEAAGASAAISAQLTQAAEHVSNFAGALDRVDTDRLRAALEGLGDVAEAAAWIIGGRAVLALTAWGARSLWAARAALKSAAAETRRAARIDRVRLRMLAGAVAARRYGRALRGASLAARGLTRALGPLSTVGLVAYGIYEAVAAVREIDEAMSDAGQSAEEFRASLEGLGKARLDAIELRLLDQITDADKRLLDTGEALERARARLDRHRSNTGRAGRSGQATARAIVAAERSVVLAAEAHELALQRRSTLTQRLIDLESKRAAAAAARPLPGHPGERSGAAGSVPPPDTTGQQQAIERLIALQASAEDRLAQLTLDRLALVDRAERQAAEQARALAAEAVQAAGQDAEAVRSIEERRQEILTSIAAAATAERGEIRREAVAAEDRERAAAHARAEQAEEQRLERRRQRIEDAAEARADAARQLDAGRDSLATPWERATAAIERWEDAARRAVALRHDTAAALAGAGPDAALHRAAAAAEAEEAYTRVAEIGARRRARAGEEEARRRLAASRRWQDGVRRGLAQVREETTDYARVAERAVTGAFRSMSDGIEEFVRTGKLRIGDLVEDVLAQFTRLAVQQAALGLFDWAGGVLALGAATTYASGAPLTGPHGVGHTGGIAGALATRRAGVPAAVFAGAPRLHRGGLASDEVPAILRRGEGVFTPEQMRALGPPAPPEVHIEIRNEGTPQRQRGQPTATWDGRRWVVGVVLADLEANGPLSQGLQQRFALPPRL